MNSEILIRILVDNDAADGLVTEHGFAVQIETNGCSILFDTGAGTALLPNCEKLGYDLTSTSLLVLSHGHYDHTGAIDQVLDCNPSLPIYAHPDVFNQRYSLHPDRPPKNISIPETQRKRLESIPHGQFHPVTEPLEIAPNVWLTGPIPRHHPLEDTGGPFFLDADRNEADPIRGDLSLWIETPSGLIVICGCCHSGLINTLSHLRSVSRTQQIRAIIGGFHLNHANPKRLAASADFLKLCAPEIIIPCHCTGGEATQFFKQNINTTVQAGYAGLELKL